VVVDKEQKPDHVLNIAQILTRVIYHTPVSVILPIVQIQNFRPGVSGHPVAIHVVKALNQGTDSVVQIATMSNRVIYRTPVLVIFATVFQTQNFRPGVYGQLVVIHVVMAINQEPDHV